MPPLVIHGFRNASDREVRYLNLHAPGRGFADYLRALRDGRTLVYDQEEPPEDGGRSKSDAIIGGGERVDDGITLLADVEEIGIVQTSSGPESGPAPLHVHRRHLQSFYVLEGEIALRVGDGELRAPAGSWIQVPPGVAHAVSCPAPARFLDVQTPSCGVGAFDEEPVS
jgi:quercetin dioxygenase-like cupin family protein